MVSQDSHTPRRPQRRYSRTRTLLMASALGLTLLGLPVLADMSGLQAQQIQPAAAPLGQQVEALSRAPISFADIVKKVRPAVVSVKVKVEGPKLARRDVPNFRDLPEGHPFNEFFKRFFGEPDGNPFQGPRRGPRRYGMAQGSGFIVSEDGYMVTNNHVVDKATDIEITLDDGTDYPAELVGTDEKTDLALLKIKANREFPYVAFAEQDIEIGDWVVAVGNPFGLGGTVTAGIVSARGRDIGSGPYDDFIQIDASINRGNSGGPAFNLNGQVVGINTAIFSPSGGSVGIGFAIPANVAKDVIAQLKANGSVTRGWLGVQIQTVTPDIAESLGLKDPEGAIVAEVQKSSPAQKAGLENGDTILAVNGQTVKDAKDLARRIGNLRPDSTAKIKILRGGKEQVVDVPLGKQPGAKVASQQPSDSSGAMVEGLGLELAAASEVPGAGKDGVVVVNVEDGSEAAAKGLQVGDTILEVGGKAVSTPEDVDGGIQEAADAERKAVLLRVQNGDRQRFVALALKKA